MDAPAAVLSRILVVDDELALRRLLRAYLAKQGFEVLEAASGEQALAVLREGGVDLAVVDVMLPELDVVRRIRARSSIPIILLTARGEETNRDGSSTARGAAGALRPRPDPSQLLEAEWGTSFVTSKTVDVHVAALRRKRGDTLKISPDLVPRLDWGEVTFA